MIKAIFGKVKLNRHICPKCRNAILNSTRKFTCDVCGYEKTDEEAKKYKIIVPPPGIRKSPARSIQKKILEIQSYRCYWCANKFGMPYWKNNRLRYLKIHWDHKIHFSFEQTNRDDNWVASCNICNLFKSNFLFKSDADCRDFLLLKWERAIKKDKLSVGSGPMYRLEKNKGNS
ncbi:MAG: hypothetical protein JRH08_11570 [Deltaproteobacteria bacterium]|nr:hypothetical protein [Deltaproteobacteria bacterium]